MALPAAIIPRGRPALRAEDLEETSPGIIQRIGRILDFPGRKIRELITGEPEATGSDVLRRVFGIEPGEPGRLDPQDIAGFLTEVALDPLTYLGGIGTLTKGGKAAARIASLRRQFDAAKVAARATEGTARVAHLGRAIGIGKKLAEERARVQALGVPEALESGARRQAEAGQRSLLKVGLPFTGLEATLLRGPRTLGAIGAVPGALRKAPTVEALERAVRPAAHRTREMSELRETLSALHRGATIQAGEESTRLGGILERLKARTGMAGDVLERTLREARETAGLAPEVLARSVIQTAGGVDKLSGFLKQSSPEFLRYLEARLGPSLRPRRIPGPRSVSDLTQGLMSLASKALPPGLPQKGAAVREAVRRGTVSLRASQALGAEGQALVGELDSRLSSLIERQIASGGTSPSGIFKSDVLEYAERILTPEARTLLRSEKGLLDGFQSAIRRGVSTKIGSQIHRIEDFREVLTSEVNDFFAKLPNRPERWFELDVSKSFPQRFLQGERSIANAEYLSSVADKFATAHVPGETISRAEFLARAPLYKFKGLSIGSDAQAIERQLAERGLGGKGIPLRVAEEALGLSEKFASPQEWNQLARAYDRVTHWYRFGATIPFPAFHLRNLLTNITMNWMARVPWRAYALAAGKLADPVEVRRLKELGVLRTGFAAEILEEIGLGPGQKTLSQNLFGEKLTKFGRQAASAVEDFSRAAHFYGRRALGDTEFEALTSVKKYLFDYQDLTQVEKKFFKRLFFFYPFTRKMLPRLLGEMKDNPARFAFLSRATTQPSEKKQALPEFARQGLGIPVGTDEQGNPVFLTGLGLPLEELSKLDPTSREGGLLGALGSFAQRAGAQLNPPLRFGLEKAAGLDFFLRRPILEAQQAPPIAAQVPGLRELLGIRERELKGGQRRIEGDPLALHVLRNLPFSRGIREAGKVADIVSGIDPRRTTLESLASFLSGVRTTRVDPEERLRIIEDLALAEATRLQREGKLAMARVPFAVGKKGERAHEAEAIAKLLREISRQKREVAGRRR